MSQSRRMRRAQERQRQKSMQKHHQHGHPAPDPSELVPLPLPDGPGVSYDEAVATVEAERRVYWAWQPRSRRGIVIGGELWALAMSDASEEYPEEPWLYVTGNTFRSSEGESGDFAAEDAPAEARALRYYPGPRTLPNSWDGMDVAIPLFELLGRPEEDAFAFLDALPHVG